MHRTALLSTVALALASRAAAQGIDSEDIAPNCATVCSNIVTVADSCERQFEDVQNEDQRELDCICNSQGLDQQIPECEACQRQYYGQDNDYDDIRTLLSRCGFSSMSVTGTMTSMGSAPTGAVGGMTTVITSTYTDPDDDNDDNDIDLETTTITSVMPTDAMTTGGAAGGITDNNLATATDAAGSAGGSATEAAGSAAESATDAVGSATDAAGSAAEQTSNFAPAITAAPVLAVAGVAAAVVGL